MGDAGRYPHDQMGVFLEGSQVDTVSTAAYEVISTTYRVTVSDRQLTLRLQNLGGSDPMTVLNGLEVIRVQSGGGQAAGASLRSEPRTQPTSKAERQSDRLAKVRAAFQAVFAEWGDSSDSWHHEDPHSASWLSPPGRAPDRGDMALQLATVYADMRDAGRP